MNDLIKVGDEAIDFTLASHKGGEVSLKDFEGKKVLLSWHPLAWTPGWLDHMRALERSYDVFVDKGIIPLGINVDHKFSKEAWGKVINVEKLDMLSDYNPLGGIAKAYGLYNEDMAASNRANILIDEEGKVEWVEVYPPGVLPDFDEVLEAIENL